MRIFDTLLNEAITHPGVIAMTENNQIQALILAFSYDNHRYKIIGPFIAQDFTLTDNQFKLLFDKLIEQQPDESIFNFSFEEGVQEYKTYMKTIHASYNFTDYYLEAQKTLEIILIIKISSNIKKVSIVHLANYI